MDLSVVTSADELKRFGTEHRDLAEHASYKNIFYEDWMLLPAIENLAGSRVKILLIFNGARLDGLFPLETRSGYRHLPLTYYSLWRHSHCFLCAPLIRKGFESEVLSAVFSWLGSDDDGGNLFLFDLMVKDHPLYPAIIRAAKERGLAVDECEDYMRPFFINSRKPDEYIRGAVSGRHLKEFRKKKRKLGELGELELRMLGSHEAVAGWIDDFLMLEKSGWKGRGNTALAADQREERFFRAMIGQAFERGRLIFLGFYLSGRPIALRCGLSDGESGEYSFKIAFGEEFSKYSPGALLELEHIRYLEKLPIDWSDSCAAPGATMLERFWTEKRPISCVSVSAERLFSKCLIASLSGLSRVKRSVFNRPQIQHAAYNQADT